MTMTATALPTEEAAVMDAVRPMARLTADTEEAWKMTTITMFPTATKATPLREIR